MITADHCLKIFPLFRDAPCELVDELIAASVYQQFEKDAFIMNASCILSWQKYPANAIGITDGSMLYLDESVFRSFVARYETMRAFIFKHFSHRFTEIIERVEAMAFHKMDSRLTDYLITRASDDSLRATHQQIANDLGASREVVSRLLKEMARKDRMRLSRNRVDLLPRIHH